MLQLSYFLPRIIYFVSCYIVLLLIKKVGFLLQNFLFSSEDENSTLKAIDFGLSDYVKPGLAYCIRYIFVDFIHQINHKW
jgi:hypothetical protein